MKNRDLLNELLRRIDRMEVALIVRDPGTSLSADAYDGLRKQVAVAARERQAHLVQLALLAEAVRSTDDTAAITSILSEYMQQAGLGAVEDPSRPELYEVVSGTGEDLEILSPAYVDEASGWLIKQGRAQARPAESKKLHKEQEDPHAGQGSPSDSPIANHAQSPLLQDGDS
jgi:hypothetical protein